jgi:hypothetical protein
MSEVGEDRGRMRQLRSCSNERWPDLCTSNWPLAERTLAPCGRSCDAAHDELDEKRLAQCCGTLVEIKKQRHRYVYINLHLLLMLFLRHRRIIFLLPTRHLLEIVLLRIALLLRFLLHASALPSVSSHVLGLL